MASAVLPEDDLREQLWSLGTHMTPLEFVPFLISTAQVAGPLPDHIVKDVSKALPLGGDVSAFAEDIATAPKVKKSMSGGRSSSPQKMASSGQRSYHVKAYAPHEIAQGSPSTEKQADLLSYFAAKPRGRKP
jgi:hypothetical protein